MIDTAQAIALGVIQGLTEYLPVSSSGHLVVAHHLFGLTEPAVFFDVVLHIGTLLAVIWFYRETIISIITGSIKEIQGGGLGALTKLNSNPSLYYVAMVIAGTIPTGLIGILFKDQLEGLFASTYWTGVSFIVNGLMLLTVIWAKDRERAVADIKWWEAVAIGVAQGVAIIPAISRSGATITLALFMGMKKELAAEFSFLLSIPAITGALILKMRHHDGVYPATSLGLGFLASLVTGYLCLILLVALMKRGKFSWFGYYCLIMGAAVLAFMQ
ncbi:MAG: undecaprenyl-diphosphate phosphatase [Nitrospinae bacterium]|nr:undecaprenyl-diphosphate phosphatase [Nitrospinota bacterium]